MKTLFTKIERFLLRNNKSFVLVDSNSSHDSSENNLNYKVDMQSPYFETLLAGTSVVRNRDIESTALDNSSSVTSSQADFIVAKTKSDLSILEAVKTDIGKQLSCQA